MASVGCGFRPVSGQVPTFKCVSRPLCASAPLTAWAYTTPGLGPLLPQVMFTGVSGGSWASKLIKVNCGKAQVSGADHGIHPRLAEQSPHAVGLLFAVDQQRRPHHLHRRAVGHAQAGGKPLGNNFHDIGGASREAASIRGSPVAITPNVTVFEARCSPVNFRAAGCDCEVSSLLILLIIRAPFWLGSIVLSCAASWESVQPLDLMQ